MLDPSSAEPLLDEGALQVEERAPGSSRAVRILWELAHDLALAALLCYFLISFVAQAFRVQGTSMLPLLHDGERIIVDKLTYRFEPIRRGDVVVFWYPRDPAVSFIKRIVALPGETIEVKRGVLLIDGRATREDYIAPTSRDQASHRPTRVPPGHYFVMGDHRVSSNDSRNWGEVPQKYIYGRALYRFWPPSKLGAIP